MPEQRTVQLHRMTNPERDGGETLGFFVRPGSRSRPYIWFEPDEAPPFAGKAGWFEIERTKGSWRVLRQIETPSRTTT